MKWFKHLTGSLNDSFVFELIERFGGDGYLVFFGTLELMADEFDVNLPGTCEFSVKKLTKNLQISRRKLTEILNFIEKKGRFLIEWNKAYIVINCPRLRELTDEYTQRQLSKMSGQGRDKLQPKEVEVEVEVDIDTPIPPKKTKPKKPHCPYQKIVEIYHASLPGLPAVIEINEEFKKRLRARWKDHPDLKWWAWYFEGISKCDFLMGKVKDWSANLYWLTGPKNMTKVLNGAYVNRKGKKEEDAVNQFIQEGSDEGPG